MNTFVEWVKSYVDVNPMSLIGYVDWISLSKEWGRGGMVFCSFLYLLLACPLAPFVYFVCTFLRFWCKRCG